MALLWGELCIENKPMNVTGNWTFLGNCGVSAAWTFSANNTFVVSQTFNGSGNIFETTGSGNTVGTPIRLSKITSGTATTGMGVGFRIDLEDGAGNSQQVGQQHWVFSDATDGSEDVDTVFRASRAGTLTTQATITSLGALQLTGTSNQLVLQSAGVTGTITWTPATSNKTLTLPNLTATVATIDGGQTFSSATWNGTAIGATFGGTAQTSWTTGDLLYASGSNTLSKLAIGSSGDVLTVSGGVPAWGSAGGVSVPLTLTLADAGTNTAATVLTETHTTSGAAANGFGIRNLWKLESGGGTTRDAAAVDITWTDATDTSEDAKWSLKLQVAGGGLTEAMAVTSTGVLSVADASGTRTSLGLAINSDVQGWDQDLTDIAGLTRNRGDLIVGGASAWTDLAIGANLRVLASDGTDPAWTVLTKSHLPAAIAYEDEANSFTAAQTVALDDAVTNGTSTLLTLRHTSTGTPLANFGTRILWQLEDSGGDTVQTAATFDLTWSDPTDGSEDAALSVKLTRAGTLTEGFKLSSLGVITVAEWQGVAVAVGFGGTGASSASGARTNLGVAIGSNVQAWDAQLDDFAGLTFAKGDIFTYDGSNVKKLAVGTDGDVLTADSAQSLGIKWATPSGGGSSDFADNVFRVSDNGDSSKKLAFECSGISASTVRTVTIPDASGTLPLLSFAQSWTAIQTFTAAPVIAIDSATTNALVTVGTLKLTTSGTAAASLGPQLLWQIEDAAGNVEDAGFLGCRWTDATNGSEDSEYVFRLKQAGTMRDRHKITSTSSTLDSHTNCGFRLTLTTATPVTTSDVTGASARTIYLTPCTSNEVWLYDTDYPDAWAQYRSAEISLALGTLTADKNYDVFVNGVDTPGSLVLTFEAWSSDTARSVAIVQQDGVWVHTTDKYKRYVGTFRTVNTTDTEDSTSKRYLWNMYNRRERDLRCHDSTNSWTYTSTTFQEARGQSTYGTSRVGILLGLQEDIVTATVLSGASDSTGGNASPGIGIDNATNVANIHGGTVSSSLILYWPAIYQGHPGLGFHYIARLEASGGAGTTTWYGDNGLTYIKTGMVVKVMA